MYQHNVWAQCLSTVYQHTVSFLKLIEMIPLYKKYVFKNLNREEKGHMIKVQDKGSWNGKGRREKKRTVYYLSTLFVQVSVFEVLVHNVLFILFCFWNDILIKKI